MGQEEDLGREGSLSYVYMLNNVIFIQGHPGLRINRKCIKK